MENINEPVVTGVTAHIDRSHYRAIVKTGSHTIVSDEPLAIGGADAGPSPQELLLASLSSCTAITLRMYIDRKMWVVDHIHVNVNLFDIDGGTLIKLKLSFEGELSDEQKKRLIQIASSCPIHKLLTGKITIETNLA